MPVRIAHHRHTLKKLPFYCTSYALLFFILVFTSAFVLLVTHYAKADMQSGSVNLTGVINAPPPEIAAQITYPQDGAHFNRSDVEVSGTCLDDTYIEIYRKDIFAGMTICAGGRFSVQITLVPGQNDLKARTRDSLGQYGPDSAKIKVYFDLEKSSIVSKDPKMLQGFYKPLLIYTDPVQRGILSGQSIKLEYEIDGNEPPYTVVIDWGDDSRSTLVKHEKEGNYFAQHLYKQAGQRTIKISGIGARGGNATIQTIIVVHPSSAPLTSSSVCDGQTASSNFSEYCTPPSKITEVVDLIWPAIIIAILMTVSFWFGEKVIYHRLKKSHA